MWEARVGMAAVWCITNLRHDFRNHIILMRVWGCEDEEQVEEEALIPEDLLNNFFSPPFTTIM